MVRWWRVSCVEKKAGGAGGKTNLQDGDLAKRRIYKRCSKVENVNVGNMRKAVGVGMGVRVRVGI